MQANMKKQLRFLTMLLTGVLLFLAIGSYNSIAGKKNIEYEKDVCETKAELSKEDNSGFDNFPDLQAPLPGYIQYSSFTPAQVIVQTSFNKSYSRKLPEQRLYILFHQLRSFIV